MIRCLTSGLFLALLLLAPVSQSVGRDVVAFWGFADDYDFSATDPTHQDFAADVDATAGVANLQAFRGEGEDLDDNGGGGFVSYTSPVSGITYDPTRTIKWDDLKGGGDDFDIGGVTDFTVDTGEGPEQDQFGNDALIYLTLDGSGYQDFEFRFDVEGTPGDLPASFDVYYRLGGAGTWYRDASHNNIALSFADYSTPDPENQYADSGYIALSSLLNNQSQIELIINDFDESGNSEMEIDNFEITANAVPEPATCGLLLMTACGIYGRRKTRV